jgi:hypothetical protein
MNGAIVSGDLAARFLAQRRLIGRAKRIIQAAAELAAPPEPRDRPLKSRPAQPFGLSEEACLLRLLQDGLAC